MKNEKGKRIPEKEKNFLKKKKNFEKSQAQKSFFQPNPLKRHGFSRFPRGNNENSRKRKEFLKIPDKKKNF